MSEVKYVCGFLDEMERREEFHYNNLYKCRFREKYGSLENYKINEVFNNWHIEQQSIAAKNITTNMKTITEQVTHKKIMNQ